MSLSLTPNCPPGSAIGAGNPSCSKMTLPSGVSSTPVAIGGTHSIANSHCSISSQCGAGALAPIMEIREMTGYCNLPDKYWTHHHPGPSSVVAGSNARHSSVYPPVFYTPPPPPPPPPPPSYSSSTAVQASGVSSGVPPSSDWSCPPPPPNPHADSYPHFLYSQYPSQHDYSNFLTIPTSCYETDIIMMGAGPPPPPPPLHASASGATYDATHPSSHQSISNSFVYLPPPPPLTSFEGILSSSTTTPTITTEKAVSEKTMLPSQISSPLSSTTDSSSSDLEEDDRHVISIEDDENENDNTSVESEISSPDLARCVLCKKTAAPLLMPPTASSPQLSKILENIDDSELDISVCSGDIEIGGIEDEMIQQVTEQHQLNSCRITLRRLAQLVGVPVSQLALSPDYDPKSDENEFAVLCTKCLKIVGMAESLDKQLTSVLDSLRQTLNTPMPEVQNPSFLSSVATQTDINDLAHENESRHCPEGKLFRTITIYLNNNTKESPTPRETTTQQEPTPENVSPVTKENLTEFFLCHFCGSNFTCGRNLGKHIKRHHNADFPLLHRISCDRTNCGQTCPDNAALQVHMRSHTGDKPYFCGNCLKLFSTKSNLTAHTKSQTCQPKSPPTPSESVLAPPSDIPIDLDPQSNLPDLNQDETGSNGKVECKNCGLRFRTMAKLQKHTMATCSRSKLFECKVCGQIFARRSELRVHEVVHTGVKSFPCDICGMTFTTRGNQKVHTRTHFMEKRFKCQHCTKEFTRKLTLQQHIIKVHNKMTED